MASLVRMATAIGSHVRTPSSLQRPAARRLLLVQEKGSSRRHISRGPPVVTAGTIGPPPRLRSLEPSKPRAPTRIRFPHVDRLQTPYTSAQLALRYGFPILQNPTNCWVAIIELSTNIGTGYSPDDVEKYCKELNIPVPPTSTINVGGAVNKFTGNKPGSADTEYALDIQVVAGATRGLINLLLINAPNNGNGFPLALQAVLDYNPPDGGFVSAVSYSWGLDERNTDPDNMRACDGLMETLLDRGITVFTASGDDGSRDDPNGNSGNDLNVDYPSSSPWAFGCGGTTITPDDIITEKAWSYGGGGISLVYPAPTWQAPTVEGLPENNQEPMRCVPDAAMDADPQSGYSIIVAGKQMTVGGTSAVAPMWAAWKACTDAVAGRRLPFSAQAAYELQNYMTDITTGSDGAWMARVGYDLCTGLGVPNSGFSAAWLKKNGVE